MGESNVSIKTRWASEKRSGVDAREPVESGKRFCRDRATQCRRHELGQRQARSAPAVPEALGALPLSFEPNRGQTDRRVRFLSRSGGYVLFLTADEAVMTFGGHEGRARSEDEARAREKTTGGGSRAPSCA